MLHCEFDSDTLLLCCVETGDPDLMVHKTPQRVRNDAYLGETRGLDPSGSGKDE
jgi:hypothetical protein